MKRFSKILNKVASLAMTAMIAFCASGCSALGADEPSSAGDGCGSVSINFSHGRVVSYDSYTDIKTNCQRVQFGNNRYKSVEKEYLCEVRKWRR